MLSREKKMDYRLNTISDDLIIWTAYLQESGKRFQESMKDLPEVRGLRESMDALLKEAALVSSKSRKLKRNIR